MQIIIRDLATFTYKLSTWLTLKHTFCYSSRCYSSARLSHRSTVSLDTDSHRWPCTQAPGTKGEQLERFEETLSRGHHRTKDAFEFPVFFFFFLFSFGRKHTRAHHPASSFRKRYRTRGTRLYHPRYRIFSRLYRKSLSTLLGSHTCHKRYRGSMPTRNYLLRRHQRRARVFSRVVPRRGHLCSADDIVSFAIAFFAENGISRIMRKLKRKYVAFGSTWRMPGFPAGDDEVNRSEPRRPRRPRGYPYPRNLSSCQPSSSSTSGRSSSGSSSNSPDPRYQNHASILRVFVSLRWLFSFHVHSTCGLNESENQLLHASFVGERYVFLILSMPVNSFESLSACNEISILSVTERAKLEEVEPELKAESRRLIALNTCHFGITLWFTPCLPNTPFSLNIFSPPLFAENRQWENERKDHNNLFFLSKNSLLSLFRVTCNSERNRKSLNN